MRSLRERWRRRNINWGRGSYLPSMGPLDVVEYGLRVYNSWRFNVD